MTRRDEDQRSSHGPGSTAVPEALDPPEIDTSGSPDGDDDGSAGAEPEVFEPPGPRRSFAPGDLLRLLLGIALVGLGALIGGIGRSTIEGVELDLLRLVARLPEPVSDLVFGIAQLVTRLIPAVALVTLLILRRWRVAVMLVLAGTLAELAMAATDGVLVGRTTDELLTLLQVGTGFGDGAPTSNTVASMTALVTVAAPWSTRRWRRALWWAVVLVVILRLTSATQPAFDVVTALGVGILVGSALLLLFGSPSHDPQPGELLDALDEVGIRPRRLERRPGVGSARRYRVVDSVGDREYDITLRTPDERDADLLARTVRRARYADIQVDAGHRRVERRIEHEALALTLAERHGVPAPRLVTIGGTDRGAAFLVTHALDDRAAEPDDLRDPTFLRSLWALVASLHHGGVAHRQLGLDAVRVDAAGQPRLDRFSRTHIAPSPRERARDVAVLLTETALVLGSPTAVDAAVEVLGPAPVGESLRMLQPLALPSSTRQRAKADGGTLDELRAEVSRRTGEPDVELDRLERVRPRTLLIIAATTIAFYSLLPQLANLGDTVDSFTEARLEWIVAAAAASVLTYLFAAISFQGAIAQSIPFTANLRSQVGSSFAALVGPAGAGGYALNVRFLQRNGLRPGEAAASVTLNGVAGFAMHFALLVGFIAWSARSAPGGAGELGIGGMSLPAGSTILLVLAVVMAVVGVLLAIRPLRARVVRPMLAALVNGVDQLAAVFRQPVRVLELFGGSTAISLTYVVAIACSVQAFGGGLTLAQIATAYLIAVAIATLAPTPGGLGALEAALVAGLTGFGLASGPAVAAVLVFRLVTFWLPILPGWIALAWMQRNGEI